MENETRTNETENENITATIKQLYSENSDLYFIQEKLKLKGLDRTIHYIRNVVYRLRTRTQAKQENNNTTQQQELKQFLKIAIKEDANHSLNLFIQTSKDFEEWLKEHKETRETENLFGENKKGKFYYCAIEQLRQYSRTSRSIDDVNSPILSSYGLNASILRIVGISGGITFKINSLHSEAFLKSSIKRFIEVFSNFYTQQILRQPIELNAEIVGVQNA